MVETRIDPRRIAAALGDPALASLAAGPLVLAAGAPPRLAHANAAALALFGADTLDALNARLFGGDEPGARRLAHIALTLSPGAPRLERLRFFIQGGSEPLMFQCVRLPGAEGFFAAGAVGVRPSLLHDDHRLARSEPDARSPAAASAAPPTTPATLNQAAQRRGSVRFLWRTDAELRFTRVDQALCEAIGCDAEDLIGATFIERAGEPGFDPEGRLCAALSRRETWSGVEVYWPMASGDVAPVTLGAAPVLDAARAFAGFSGFGFIHLDRIIKREAVTEVQAYTEPALEAAVELRTHPAPPQDIARREEDRASELAAAGEREKVGYAPAAAFLAPNVVALSAWKSSAAMAPAFAQVSAGEPPPVEMDADQTPRGHGDATQDDGEELVRLTPAERNAFRDIARALGARIEEADKRRAKREAAEQETPVLDEDSEAAPATAQNDWDAMRRLLDRVDVGLMVCRGGEAVFLNRALLDVLGHESFESFCATGGLARMFRGRLPEGQSTAGAVAVTTRAGTTIGLEGKLQSIEWEGGPAMLTTFRKPVETDATARAAALSLDLAASRDRVQELDAILDAAADGVVVLDAQGRIRRVNASAQTLLGYTENEAAGAAFSLLLAPESHREAAERLRLAVEKAGPNEVFTLVGQTRGGVHLPLSARLAKVGDDTLCAVLRDVSQWRQAERELIDARQHAEQASALKSDFLAKISHEIRTPLNAIIGFAEVILEERFGPLGNERYRDYLKDIHASGAHVMSLVNDLLDLSKIEAGKLELNLTSVDANAVLSECVSMMQAQAIRERVVVRVSLAPHFPRLQADERALRQIVLNLLSNAIKFNQPGGQVIVSTAISDGGGAVLRVRDTGLGMSDAEIETALEPFRQIQSGRQANGTGLGLPLTKALVEAHRASFAISSRKGEGTLVEIVFPAQAATP